MSAPRRSPTGTQEVVEGLVGREDVAEGSKSSHAALGVREASGAFVVVHVEGDTPFAEETLSGLEGQAVRASGTWRNGKLRVAPADLSVLAAPEPAPPEIPASPAAPAGVTPPALAPVSADTPAGG